MTSTMRTLTGIGVSPGSAIGPVAVVRPPQPLPATEPCSADPQQDLTRVADSLFVVVDDLDAKATKLERLTRRWSTDGATTKCRTPHLTNIDLKRYSARY